MTRTFHLCQSVAGPLKNWNLKDWKRATKFITRQDGSTMTVNELKDAFLDQLAQGHKVIPIGSECDNFNYQTGCQGHPKEP